MGRNLYRLTLFAPRPMMLDARKIGSLSMDAAIFYIAMTTNRRGQCETVHRRNLEEISHGQHC
jgi:hypothetical protein